jgi:choline dehydrogenase-like flavoprotein
MEQFDVLVVGAATAGSYFARKIAEAGHSVLVLDKLTQETLGHRLDIFHVVKGDFARFGFRFRKKATTTPLSSQAGAPSLPLTAIPRKISKRRRHAYAPLCRPPQPLGAGSRRGIPLRRGVRRFSL